MIKLYPLTIELFSVLCGGKKWTMTKKKSTFHTIIGQNIHKTIHRNLILFKSRDKEKLEQLYIADRNVKLCSHLGKQCDSSSKKAYAQGKKKSMSREKLYTCVYRTIIHKYYIHNHYNYSSQVKKWKQTKCLSLDE